MCLYEKMNKTEIETELSKLNKEYVKFQNMNLNLNMSRGKPCPDQLELSSDMIDKISYSQ